FSLPPVFMPQDPATSEPENDSEESAVDSPPPAVVVTETETKEDPLPKAMPVAPQPEVALDKTESMPVPAAPPNQAISLGKEEEGGLPGMNFPPAVSADEPSEPEPAVATPDVSRP